MTGSSSRTMAWSITTSKSGESWRNGDIKFGTTSDTEVILAAYREWGANCVTRFVGMWSFAIWDRAKKELFCSRDRFGIKPFYYIHSGDRFYFGSEYAPLKLSPIFNSTFDLVQISLGLRMGIGCSQEDTYFRCLKALPERCNLLFKEGKLSLMPYWDICRVQIRSVAPSKRSGSASSNCFATVSGFR